LIFPDKDLVSSQLKNYKLFYDGDIEVSASSIVDFVMANGALPEGVYVDVITDEIKQFNRYSSAKLQVKTELNDLSLEWSIPEAYIKMDIESHIKSIPLDDDNIDLRIARRDKEIELFRKYGLEDILRLVVFIVDTLKEKNVVWGTGRGSSCSSYLFYIIGLHCVDVIKYDIPIHDFFKQEKST
jgi:DNA polymerase III alpha subunit